MIRNLRRKRNFRIFEISNLNKVFETRNLKHKAEAWILKYNYDENDHVDGDDDNEEDDEVDNDRDTDDENNDENDDENNCNDDYDNLYDNDNNDNKNDNKNYHNDHDNSEDKDEEEDSDDDKRALYSDRDINPPSNLYCCSSGK